MHRYTKHLAVVAICGISLQGAVAYATPVSQKFVEAAESADPPEGFVAMCQRDRVLCNASLPRPAVAMTRARDTDTTVALFPTTLIISCAPGSSRIETALCRAGGYNSPASIVSFGAAASATLFGDETGLCGGEAPVCDTLRPIMVTAGNLAAADGCFPVATSAFSKTPPTWQNATKGMMGAGCVTAALPAAPAPALPVIGLPLADGAFGTAATGTVGSGTAVRLSAKRSKAASDPAFGLLRKINHEVNRQVIQVSDLVSAGVPEQWNRTGETGHPAGDCEDIAIEKRLRLVEAGFAPDKLFFAVVYRANFGLHVVLVAHLAEGDMVLDSARPQIDRWDQAPYSWVRVQSMHDPMLWSRVAVTGRS